jgi:hypothetical protein
VPKAACRLDAYPRRAWWARVRASMGWFCWGQPPTRAASWCPSRAQNHLPKLTMAWLAVPAHLHGLGGRAIDPWERGPAVRCRRRGGEAAWAVWAGGKVLNWGSPLVVSARAQVSTWGIVGPIFPLQIARDSFHFLRLCRSAAVHLCFANRILHSASAGGASAENIGISDVSGLCRLPTSTE